VLHEGRQAQRVRGEQRRHWAEEDQLEGLLGDFCGAVLLNEDLQRKRKRKSRVEERRVRRDADERNMKKTTGLV
jgi:hypothetical protein